MKNRRSLHAQIRRLLGGYAVLLAAIILLVFADDFLEDWVWKSLLQQEISHYVQQKIKDPDHTWQDTDTLQLYSVPGRQPPPGLSMLPQGVHDDFWFGGRENVVLVHRVQGVDYFVVRDITGIETIEDALLLGALALAFVVLVIIGVLVARGVRKALRPLSDLAGDIGALSPDHAGQRSAYRTAPAPSCMSSPTHSMTICGARMTSSSASASSSTPPVTNCAHRSPSSPAPVSWRWGATTCPDRHASRYSVSIVPRATWSG
jgi:hypothetical protein